MANCYPNDVLASGLVKEYVCFISLKSSRSISFLLSNVITVPWGEFNWWASAVCAIFSCLQLRFLISTKPGVLLLDHPTTTPSIMFVSDISVHIIIEAACLTQSEKLKLKAIRKATCRWVHIETNIHILHRVKSLLFSGRIINCNNWPLQPRGADISYTASSKLTYLQSLEVHLSTFYTCWHLSCVCLRVRSVGKVLCKVNKECCPAPALINFKLMMFPSFSCRGSLFSVFI